MKKIVWFSYNEKSILNNNFIRGLNYILLGIFALGPVTTPNFKGVLLSYLNLLAIIILSPAIMGYCLEKVEKNTTFYEWDYTERKKKRRFMFSYIGLCSTLSICFVLSLCVLYSTITQSNLPIFVRIIVFLPPIIFAFNIVNIPSLFYPTFKNDLRQEYKIQKRPDNWKDDGKEITPDDEIEEIMARDWGIGQ